MLSFEFFNSKCSDNLRHITGAPFQLIARLGKKVRFFSFFLPCLDSPLEDGKCPAFPLLKWRPWHLSIEAVDLSYARILCSLLSTTVLLFAHKKAPIFVNCTYGMFDWSVQQIIVGVLEEYFNIFLEQSELHKLFRFVGPLFTLAHVGTLIWQRTNKQKNLKIGECIWHCHITK